MRFTAIICCAIFLTLMPYVLAREPEDVAEFRDAASLTRQVWQTIKPLPNWGDLFIGFKTAEKIEVCRELPQIGDGGSVLLVLAQGHVRRDFRTNRNIDAFRKALAISNAVEWFDTMARNPGNYMKNHTIHFKDIFFNPRLMSGDIFPIRIQYEADMNVAVKWEHYPFPNMRDSDCSQLPLCFEQLGMYDRAWRVLMEHGRVDSNGQNNYEESFYLRAANCAYRAGKKDLAWSFLMNAAVFEDESYFEPAMKVARRWIAIKNGNAELPKQKVAEGKERKDIFLNIVRQYQKMNAHPRAWEIVQENKKEFDDPAALIKELQDDWLKQVNSVIAFSTKYVVYGAQVHPKKGGG